MANNYLNKVSNYLNKMINSPQHNQEISNNSFQTQQEQNSILNNKSQSTAN